MTTNTECAMAVLAAHREARQWDDGAVAADLLAQLGLAPDGNAAKAKPHNMPGITEDEVVAHETAAKEATDKAVAARAALKAQSMEATPSNLPPRSDAARMAAERQAVYARDRAQATQNPQNAAAPPMPPASPSMPATPAGPMTTASVPPGGATRV